MYYRGKKGDDFVQRLSNHGNPAGCSSIKEVIDTIFATSALPIDIDDMKIWKLWNGVVGRKKAEEIKESLNSKLQRQAIKKIRLRVGTT